MEMRNDVRALRAAVDAVAREQALSVERRASMQRVADTITARLDSHEKAILDLQRWRDEAAGAIRLARWALGASLVASVLMLLQIAALMAHAVNPAVPSEASNGRAQVHPPRPGHRRPRPQPGARPGGAGVRPGSRPRRARGHNGAPRRRGSGGGGPSVRGPDGRLGARLPRELPTLWARTSDAGRHAIAEATFERIDVLGVTNYTITLTAHPKARGWDAAFGAGIFRVKEGQYGRGERI